MQNRIQNTFYVSLKKSHTKKCTVHVLKNQIYVYFLIFITGVGKKREAFSMSVLPVREKNNN